jgi:hypothetical protein
MPSPLNTEQILALAPDPSSAKAGEGLAVTRKWVSLGFDGAAAWGECQGSGAKPYQTSIDMGDTAFKCTCPSHKFPCKHSLGLLLLLARQPGEFTQKQQPAWASDWLANRVKRSEQQTRKAAAPTAAPSEDGKVATPAADPAKHAAQRAKREKRVLQGLDDLSLWMRDLMRGGLASVQGQPVSYWEVRAARMVDAQAPGAARMIREMSGIPYSGTGWQERLLERLGRLHLLVEGYRRLDALPPETQDDLRAAMGWTQSQDDLLDAPPVRDNWLVLGQRVEEDDRLRTQRTWLLGSGTGRFALLLQFAHGKQPFDPVPMPGQSVDADLAFYPGSYPLRALLRQRHGTPETYDVPEGLSIAAAIEAHGQAVACNPWLERVPFLLEGVTPYPEGDGWFLRDATSHIVPLSPRFERGWDLLAFSGGRPITLFGEWNERHFRPLSAWGYRFVQF